MFGLIIWLFVGTIVGWVGSILLKTRKEVGAFRNIAVSILGAMFGGALLYARGLTTADEILSFSGLLVVALCASIMLGVANLFRIRSLKDRRVHAS